MRFPRRSFLRAASGLILPLPALASMNPRGMRSTGDGMPSRVLWWFNPNGNNYNDWPVEGEGSDFVFSPTLEPFEDYRDRLTVLSGLKIEACQNGLPDGHNGAAATYLTCMPLEESHVYVGQSIDQRLAQEWNGVTPFQSLELGMETGAVSDDSTTGTYRGNISWAGPETPRPKVSSPGSLFDRLFGGGDASLSPEEAERRLDLRLSILDDTLEELNRLSARLSASDRRKLDEYATAIRELELRLASMGVLSCDPGESPGNSDLFPDTLEAMCDLMALAFQCDLTRVITFMLGNEGTNQAYTWLGLADGHHSLSHHAEDPEVMAQLSLIDRWQSEVFVGLLDRLDAIEEPGGGSLLDNTVLLYGGGMADGHYHTNEELPLVLLGGTEVFDHGRHVHMDGGPLSELHLAICSAVGVDLPSWGMTGTSPMTGLAK